MKSDGRCYMERYFRKLSVGRFVGILVITYVILTIGYTMVESYPDFNIEYLLMVLFYALLFLGYFIFALNPVDREGILYERKSEEKPLSLAVIPFFIMGLTTIIYVLLLESLFPTLYEAFVNAPDILEGISFSSDPMGFGLLFLSVVVLAPVVEEIVFRGILFNLLNKKRGLLTSMFASSLFFGVLHFQTMVPTAVIGFVLCFIYQKTGSLKLSMAGHMFNNLMAFALPFLLEGLDPSGTVFILLNVAFFLLYLFGTIYFISYMVKHRRAFRGRAPIYRAWGDEFDL